MSAPARREGPAPSWRSLRVGVSLLASLALLLAAIFFLDALRREITEGPRLVVTTGEARDLAVGSEVWVAGVPAGRVTALHFRPPGARGGLVLVDAVLEPGAAKELRADASVTIRASTLLGPAILSVDPGRSPEGPYDFGDTLTARPQATPREVMARSDSLLARLRTLRPRGRELARRLEEGPGTLASLRRHPDVLRGLSREARRTGELALATRGGTVPRLLADTALGERAREVVRRLRDIQAGLRAREAAGGDGAAGRARALASVLDSLDQRARSLEEGLAAGRGTAGRALHDRAIEREISLMRSRVDALRTRLLADPLRWIRFRIF
ncbi:MAG TPA: MlaD family protein [Gemmatimonadota bacterium]|nr:MlaD family protein [Gemmatimonadota bacterium]